MKRRLALWGPVALWAGLLFFASSRSDVGPVGRIPDWLTHGASYLVLAALLLRALTAGAGRRFTLGAALLAVAVASLYGVSDEWHQSFVPGRTADITDLRADATGAILGTGVCWLWGIIRSRSTT